jgi:arylsulfatase A-like enzyme
MAQMAVVDEAIGNVVDALKQKGMFNDTLVTAV